MKKSTKGAFAAFAAGSLLLGGTGSLAYWTAEQDVTGQNIASGDLTLSVPDCDGTPNAATHGWEYADGDTFDANSRIVPGDVITKVCEMTLTLDGDNIGATLSLDSPTFGSANDLTAALVTDATFLVDGVAYAPITDEGDGTKAILATLEVELPTTATDGQALTAALQDLTLTATQTHNP